MSNDGNVVVSSGSAGSVKYPPDCKDGNCKVQVSSHNNGDVPDAHMKIVANSGMFRNVSEPSDISDSHMKIVANSGMLRKGNPNAAQMAQLVDETLFTDDGHGREYYSCV